MENKYSFIVEVMANGKHIPAPLYELKELDVQDYYFTKYKGIYYRYIPKVEGSPYWEVDKWEISDREDRMGNIMVFAATKYRLDQCIELFKKEVNYGK